MAVSLSKGNKVDLKKEDGSNLIHAIAGMSWDINRYDGGFDFDLDVCAFLLGADGKVRTERDFIFYKNPDDEAGCVHHMGDNRTGAGDGDDEQIMIDLSKVPEDVVKIDITCTIYDAAARKQNFGMVENAMIKIYDADTNTALFTFDLTEEGSNNTAIVVGSFYKYNGKWKFNPIGNGFQQGLDALCHNYGLETV